MFEVQRRRQPWPWILGMMIVLPVNVVGFSALDEGAVPRVKVGRCS